MGIDPNPFLPGSFTPLEELTPSTLPSELSDLDEPSKTSYSLRLVAIESNSKGEVTLVLLQPSGSASTSRGVTTRSRARAQAQLQLQLQAPTPSPLATQQLIAAPAIPTTIAPITATTTNLAAPQQGQPIAGPAAQIQVPAAQAPVQIQAPAPPVQVVIPLAPSAVPQAPAPPAQVPAPPIQSNAPQIIPANPMALANLPSRNERSVPSFNKDQPEELD